MSETVQRLVDAIRTGDAIATETAFADAMAERIVTKIDDMRQSIASSMFAQAEQSGQEETITTDTDEV